MNHIPVVQSLNSIQFDVNLLVDQCVLTVFDGGETIPDLTFTLSPTATTLTHVFSDFTDSITRSGAKNCGPRKYVLFGDSTKLQFNSATRTLSYFSTDVSLIGTYSYTLVCTLNDFPLLAGTVRKVVKFNLVITDPCLTTSINFDSPSFIIPLLTTQTLTVNL